MGGGTGDGAKVIEVKHNAPLGDVLPLFEGDELHFYFSSAQGSMPFSYRVAGNQGDRTILIRKVPERFGATIEEIVLEITEDTNFMNLFSGQRTLLSRGQDKYRTYDKMLMGAAA
jgi:hypothetical protein